LRAANAAAQCADPCGDLAFTCGGDLANTLVGFGTIGGSGGWRECIRDLGINTPFLAADLTAISEQQDPEARHNLIVRLTFDTMCDILDCMPASAALPNVAALRAMCQCGRAALSGLRCWEAHSQCRIQQGTLPIGDPTRPDGECAKSTVMNSCSTPLSLIEEQCRNIANGTNLKEPSLTNCYKNCLSNTLTLQDENCEKKAKGGGTLQPAGPGGTVPAPILLPTTPTDR
jgi:hypothetical protein